MQTFTKIYLALTIFPNCFLGTKLCDLAPWNADCVNPNDVISIETSTMRATNVNDKPSYEMTTMSQFHNINQGTLHNIQVIVFDNR